ncbi:SOCS6_7 [Acanthosepion pharaonis]|uniref:SOCS6_7 n=1 Tax=Acanthosepion pharaonis TaxID=158019 RepID=A0A812B3S6_ACAPH|nr:SOCS6_7 [Sepia pharaonis]
MGACHSHHSVSLKHLKLSNREYFERLFQSSSGELVWSCSYTKWVRGLKNVNGFSDKTDFCSNRDTHRRYGILVKPDNTDGQHFGVRLPSIFEAVISTKNSEDVVIDGLNPFAVFNTDMTVRCWDPWPVMFKEASIIGYHDNLAVLQLNPTREDLTAIFYVLDLDRHLSLADFSIAYYLRRWYECYISPLKKRILLRPDHSTRVLVIPDNYLLRKMRVHPSNNITISTVSPTLRAKVLTFNAQAGDNCIIVSWGRCLQVQHIESGESVRSVENLSLPAGIQQIRSSKSGDFLAVRCVQPVHAKEYKVNVVGVLDYRKLEVLMTIDVKGCYWPFSEVINLQVFPRFSPSEACIAVMKNLPYKRQVFTYKLPVVHLNLQYLCRRRILHLVSMDDVKKLPLPCRLIEYLQCVTVV